jgi:hypothetical protein
MPHGEDQRHDARRTPEPATSQFCSDPVLPQGASNMNTANLQLEGLYLAIAAINNALVKKGLLSRDEIDLALRRAEQTAIGDDRMVEDMSASNRDAVAFPARLLALANRMASTDEISTFSELARMVGSTKEPYNDQR